jgi:hypothetical protein
MSTTIVSPELSTREESLKNLRQRLVSVNLRDDQFFLDIFREAKVLLELKEADISKVLLVSRPTVNRWTNGKNLPHPAMRKPIFDWISEELTQRIRVLNASHSYAGGGAGSYSSGKVAAKSI